MACYILLDTETTGHGDEDRICQLAFITLKGRSVEVHNSLCKPPLAIKYEAMAVHHITEEMVEDKPSYALCDAARILDDLNAPENVLIIQNAPFDLGMLEKEGFVWKGKLIDTLRCMKHLEPELSSHGLQFLRYAKGFYKEEESIQQEMGLASIQAHDALGDVIVLRQLMSYLVAKVDRDIERLIALTQAPILYRTFRFGKYKDREIAEIAREDAGYLRWMLEKMDNLDDDMRYTLKQALGTL